MHTNPIKKANGWWRTSITAKLVAIGVLIIFLLIPATLLDGLIFERLRLRDQAQTEVAAKWGLQQTIGGPVISVPYTETVTDDEGNTTISRRGYAHFLPELLEIDGQVQPEERYRGIYVVVLYNSQIQIEGQFNTLNENALGLQPDALHWDQALLTLGITDMTGINAAINMEFSGETYRMGPGTRTKDIFESGASIGIDLSQNREELSFSVALDINGSAALFFRPFAQTTRLNLNGSWANPSFSGQFLPKERSIEGNDFSARWEILELNRNYPQQGTGGYIPQPFPNPSPYVSSFRENATEDINSDRFGLRLLLPVDEYKKTERSTKYAMLFVFITFLTFFFIEVLNRQQLHPIQYLLIGAAVIIFYVLLLSISEHLAFNRAYWISCAAVVGLITAYSWFILRNRKLTLLVAAVLLICYLFFYSLLQLQDYALLMGSVGLFLILATIMYLTRNIDWYNIGKEVAAGPVDDL
ncbi:MAG: cell envelope integrity protein CreD [Bacteroidota bacterium]